MGYGSDVMVVMVMVEVRDAAVLWKSTALMADGVSTCEMYVCVFIMCSGHYKLMLMYCDF
jgi:hypothetical protein